MIQCTLLNYNVFDYWILWLSKLLEYFGLSCVWNVTSITTASFSVATSSESLPYHGEKPNQPKIFVSKCNYDKISACVYYALKFGHYAFWIFMLSRYAICWQFIFIIVYFCIKMIMIGKNVSYKSNCSINLHKNVSKLFSASICSNFNSYLQ